MVAPGLTPRSNADRIKNDRRDALKLCRLARAGELTAIHVPDALDEAMRDWVRTREDAVDMQRQARQRFAALLLRNNIRYSKKTTWTEAHRRWVAELGDLSRFASARELMGYLGLVPSQDSSGARRRQAREVVPKKLKPAFARPLHLKLYVAISPIDGRSHTCVGRWQLGFDRERPPQVL